MLKSGDVIVVDEKKLHEALVDKVMADVRQGKAAARKLIEESDDALELVVVRIERVARAKARKPAFDCAFDDDGGEGGAA